MVPRLGARGEDVRGGLEPAQAVHAAGVHEDEQGPVIEALQAHIEDLRQQLAAEHDANRENRMIIAGLTQRIPELEAASPSEPPAARESERSGYEHTDR